MAATCAQHPEREATATCTRCGVFICALDTQLVDLKPYCPACGSRPDVDWLEAYRQRFLGKREGWAWLFALGVPVNLFYAFAAVSAFFGDRPVREPLLTAVAAVLLLAGAVNGVLWFLGRRVARTIHLVLAAGWSVLLVASASFDNAGVFVVLSLTLFWLIVLVPILGTRSKLFFRLPVSRDALRKDYQRMEDNRLARWGVVLGLFGFLAPPAALAALACGVVALRRVNPDARPPVGNKGQAILAIAFGLTGGVVSSIWWTQTRVLGFWPR